VKLAAPAIIGAIVAKLPTLEGWDAAGTRPATTVFEGAKTSRDDSRRWATVGYVSSEDGAAVHLEPVHLAQSQNREAGSIGCELIVTAANIATARTAAFELLLPWSVWLSRDPTLTGPDGKPALLAGSSLSLAADVVLTTTRAGATASAVVTITYTAVTYG